MKRLLLFILPLYSLLAYSQPINEKDKDQKKMASFLNSLNENKNGEPNKKETAFVGNRDHNSSNEHVSSSIIGQMTDNSSAFYLYVAKQNGWFVGIGPALSKNEASHLNVVYRLSNKNRKGHWTKLEALDGYGNLTTDHGIDTYVALRNRNDSTIDKEWIEKLRKVCQWEFMPDGSGDHVVIERAYDKDKNLIFSYQPVFISDNEIIGSYTDSWGFPAKMKSKEKGEGAISVLVDILLDRLGNDSIIKLIDTNGNLLQNYVGAWMVKYICDKHGNILENYSLNKLGGMMNDNDGNCSWKCERDKYGNQLYVKFYDAGGNIVRIPSERSDRSVKEISFGYDRWHRMTSQSFFSEGKPDTTHQGVHCIEYTYNNHGQLLSSINRGINNEPKAYGKHGAAFEYNIYDQKGKLLSNSYLGPDSTFIDNDKYYCQLLYVYEQDSLKEKAFYSRTGNDTILWHFESFSPIVNTYFDRNRKAYVDSLDNRGNMISRTYISVDQDPRLLADRNPVSNYPYSRKVSKYSYGDHFKKEVTTYYDEKGCWTGVMNANYDLVARNIIITDSINNTIQRVEFDKDSLMLSNYQEVYDDKFESLVTKQSITTMGNIGRSGRNDVIYYNSHIEYSPTGKVSSILFLNEFDEPTYATSYGNVYCYQVNDNNDKYKKEYYDEDRNLIKKDIPGTEAACVEIISEIGKKNGLMDGDMLVRFGDWTYNHKTYYRGELYVSMIFASRKDSIDVWVLRHYPDDKRSKILKLKIKSGKNSDLGFITNRIYLTRNEIQRYLNTYIDFKDREERTGGKLYTMNRKGLHKAIIVVPPYTSNKKSAFNSGWKDPFLIISDKSESKPEWPVSKADQIWHYGLDTDSIDALLKMDSQNYLLNASEDGIHIKRGKLDGDAIRGKDYYEVRLTAEENLLAMNMLNNVRSGFSFDLIPKKQEGTEFLSQNLSENVKMNTTLFVDSIEKSGVGYRHREKKSTPHILNHIEGIDSMKVYKVYLESWNQNEVEKVKRWNRFLDKRELTMVSPQDAESIAETGIVYLKNSPTGINEILYLSRDTVVFASGNMTFGTKDIVEKNLFGKDYVPSDKYNEKDLDFNNVVASHSIAQFWQSCGAYNLSYPVIKQLCKRKYGPAYTTLAEAYMIGGGVPKDTLRAIHFYQKALKAGENVNMSLGSIFYKKRKNKLALFYLRRVMDSDSYYLMGTIFEKGGGGIVQNSDSSSHYYKEGLRRALSYSERAKFSSALERISGGRTIYLLSDFQTSLPDSVTNWSASKLFSKGWVAYMLDDYIGAYPYLKAAADMNYPKAEEYMAKYMMEEQYPFHNQEKAFDYLRRSVEHYLVRAEKGDSTAYHQIGLLYRNYDVEGNGIDIEKARFYYKKGMKYNEKYSAESLGDLYYSEYRYAEALEAYKCAATQGLTDCMYKVGLLYEQGLGGVERNIPQAIYWYRLFISMSYSKSDKEKAKAALQRLGATVSDK